MRTFAAILVVSIALGFCVQVFADNKDEAKKHFESGLALLKTDDFSAAAMEFEESLELFKTKGAMFNLANCYKAMHRYAEAMGTLKRLESEFKGAISGEMTEAIDGLKSEIENMTGIIDVQVDKAGAEIFVDGDLIGTSPLPEPLLLGPGYREIKVTMEGMETYTKRVKLVARKQVSVEAMLQPEEEGPPKVSEPGKDDEWEEEEDGEGDMFSGAQTDAGRSPVLLGLSMTGTAITVGLGVVAGVFFKKKSAAEDDYNNYLGLYEELDPASTGYDFTAEEERIFGKLEGARDDVDKNNKLAIGMTVGAGVMAATSVVLWVLWAKSGDGEAEVAFVKAYPAPQGLLLTF